jgi:hypothetical protein
MMAHFETLDPASTLFLSEGRRDGTPVVDISIEVLNPDLSNPCEPRMVVAVSVDVAKRFYQELGKILAR